MLYSLHIENIAVIESADISFERGFHVLTGETGAGKSIIIDSINAILGERAYRDMIRSGCKKGHVSAIFTDVPELTWFSDNDIPYDPDELLIQRDIFSDGKNQCRVNGKPVTVSILRQLGVHLISIHGQHDSSQLFDESTHLAILDLYADNDDIRNEYSDAYVEMSGIEKEIQRLTLDESEKIRKTEMLQHQIQEIDSANISEGEDEELEAKRKIMQNAERISDGFEEIYSALNGTDQYDGAAQLLKSSVREVQSLQRYHNGLDEINKRLENLMYEAEDICDEIRDLKDGMDFSPRELERIEDRLTVINRLKKKYGPEIKDILLFRNEAQTQLDDIVFADEKLNKLKELFSAAEAKTLKIAERLSEKRQEAGISLSQRIESELTQLDMPKIKFLCQFSRQKMNEAGIDALCFMMSANVGEDLKPLSKVASGGELARIMLAIKNVLAEKDDIPTLIFDEVDAGVSGRAAQKVAEKLKALSKNKQVLCVSHLPQLAALADVHLFVSKHVENGRTYTSVVPLTREGRIEEIARIIGGSEITDVTRKSAAEMLSD